MDEMMTFADPRTLELERRLSAFADARLAPDAIAMRRMRRRLLGRQAVIVARTRTEETRPTQVVPGPWMRRAAASLLAASLGLALVAGTAFAAHAGGPLYEARIWMESLTLPREPVARAEAELARLRARVAEALEAATAGDLAAAEAAMQAYDDILAEAEAGVRGDPDAEHGLALGLGRDAAGLERLLALVPDQARAHVAAALGHSRAVVAADGGSPSGPHHEPAAGAGGNPAATEKPTPSPKPVKPGTGPGTGNTGKPSAGTGTTGKDHATPSPAPSPSPTPTVDPSHGPHPGGNGVHGTHEPSKGGRSSH
ncbi:MAG: hypothetical protein ACJ761_08355 [Chloroflexota bacterium]